MKKTSIFIGVMVIIILLVYSYRLDENEAADIAVQSVIDTKLTDLSRECILVLTEQKNYKQIIFELREKHDATCGGDPDVAPRIAFVVVNLYTHSINPL